MEYAKSQGSELHIEYNCNYVKNISAQKNKKKHANSGYRFTEHRTWLSFLFLHIKDSLLWKMCNKQF